MSMTLTVSEFLLARYSEEEAEFGLRLADLQDLGPGQPGERYGFVSAASNYNPRKMAEVEAHRSIVEEARVFGEVDGTDQTLSTKLVTRGAVTAYDRTLRALASVYSGHEDYRAEWAL